MNIEIANRLVELRKKNNLSQEALAEKLGISRQAVSKWERAEASPDTDNLILLVYLIIGCIWNAWHPGWIVFLTIPFYYEVVSYLQKRGNADGEE